MAPAAVLWFGEIMSAVPLRNGKAMASGVRRVSVLGATGSIGDSTMDLLRASRHRYQVEALTANTNVQALATLAREFGARFAAVADASRLNDLRSRAVASPAAPVKARLSKRPSGRPTG
jgi:1-deoxy-D-xylulose-5-phosphate reductoisomerase